MTNNSCANRRMMEFVSALIRGRIHPCWADSVGLVALSSCIVQKLGDENIKESGLRVLRCSNSIDVNTLDLKLKALEPQSHCFITNPMFWSAETVQ